MHASLERGSAATLSEIGLADQVAPEPLKRVIVEVPEALIDAMAYRDYVICLHQRHDFIAIIGALMRRGYEPRITKSPAGETVLSF